MNKQTFLKINQSTIVVLIRRMTIENCQKTRYDVMNTNQYNKLLSSRQLWLPLNTLPQFRITHRPRTFINLQNLGTFT